MGLTVSLLAGTFPAPAYAQTAEGPASRGMTELSEQPGASDPSGTAPAVFLGTNGIGSPVPGPVEEENRDVPWEGSYVYYGQYPFEAEGVSVTEPVKYRILDPRTQKFSGESKLSTMLLDCDSVLYQEKFIDSETPTGNDWADSLIRSELNGSSFYGKEGVFTALEKAAITSSSIPTHYPREVQMPAQSGGNLVGYVPLENDHVFLLDAEDLSNPAYGYTPSYIGGNRMKQAMHSDGYGRDWWTRTAQSDTSQGYRAGYVCADVVDTYGYSLRGALNVKFVNAYCGVSPAFNVDLSRVVFAKPLASQENCHKLSLLDSGISLSGLSVSETDTDDAYELVVSYQLTDVDAQFDPTLVSYVVSSGKWSEETGWSADAEVLQYGKLAAASANGGSFSVDRTKASGNWGQDYHVYLVAEVQNDGEATDYASAPVEIESDFTKTYIDAEGEVAYATGFTRLTGSESGTLDAGWYYAEGSLSYGQGLSFSSGDVHLILADGCDLKIGSENSPVTGSGLNLSGGHLYVYGQSEGSGALTICSTGDSIYAGSGYTQCGGNVKLVSTGAEGIYSNGAFCQYDGILTVNSKATSLWFSSTTVCGGRLDAVTTDTERFYAVVNTLELRIHDPEDSVHFNRMNCTAVTVAEGKAVTEGNTLYVGALTNAQIADKNLVPAYTVSVADGITGGRISAYKVQTTDRNFVAANDADKTFAYSSSPENGFLLEELHVLDEDGNEIPHNNNLFTVPDSNVVISAVFGRIPTDLGDTGADYVATDGEILTGSCYHGIAIADGASITLDNASIGWGIICKGSATITLSGTNSVKGEAYQAGIQVGGAGSVLTIRGKGALEAKGGDFSAGIGLGRAFKSEVRGGDIVIEDGTITANGNGKGAGIGTGICYGDGASATLGNIIIKGGTIKAVGGDASDAPPGIGKGIAYSGGEAFIGSVGIYDSVELVDAAGISESIRYMSGESDVSADPEAYFAISEFNGRSIIGPRETADYGIRLKVNTNNGGGTATAPETAKYLELVSVDVNPGFGSHLVTLEVRDEKNQEIEIFGNCFVMPRGSVTVTVQFSLGVHGGAVYDLKYDDTNGGTTDQRIGYLYEGVTTVMIQYGLSYYFIEFMSPYQRFYLLGDSDNYEAIPFAGGMGKQSSNYNTRFKLDYEATGGYYDFTLTRVDKDSWYISIVKTAPVVDVIPDQEYTGSAVTPDPMVLLGSLEVTKGTDYEYSYENNTAPGKATVTITFKGDYASFGSVKKEFNIVRAVSEPAIEVAAATYTGSALEPAVTVKDGETVIDPSEYELSFSNNVNVALSGDENAPCVTVTDKPGGSYSVNGSRTFTILPKTAVLSWRNTELVYNGSAQSPTASVSNLVTGDACSVSVSGEETNAGEYTATASGLSNRNYKLPESSEEKSTAFSIAKKKLTIKGITAETKEYDGGTEAELDLSNAEISGLVENDTVEFTVTGAFADAGKGDDKTVTLSGWNLTSGGTNYEIDAAHSQKTATASITGVQVYISGISAKNKEYDGNVAAQLEGTAVLKRVNGDSVPAGLTVSNVTASFASRNAGSGIDVSITGGRLSDAENYALNLDVTNEKLGLAADITKKTVDVTVAAGDKTYDATTDAELTVSVSGTCAGDVILIEGLRGAFSDKNAASGKTVTIDKSGMTVSGNENYQLSDIPASVTADINKRSLADEGVRVLPVPMQNYTGSALEPKPVVKWLSITLEEGADKDYMLSYENNTDVGTASVRITGSNNFEGTISKDFTIGLPAFGTLSLMQPADKDYGEALGAAPTVTARDGEGRDIALTGENVKIYYSASSAGAGTEWDPEESGLHTGTWHVWAVVEEKAAAGSDPGHAAASSARLGFKVNKIPQLKPADTVLPEQAAGYEVTLVLPANAKNADFEYAVTETSVAPASDSALWSVVPALSDGKFALAGLSPATDYTVWLRRKADANHTPSEAIGTSLQTPASVLLSYDANGGSGTLPTPKTYVAGSGHADRIDDGSNISRHGYRFTGWNTKADGSGMAVAAGKTDFAPSATTILYAQWEANRYSVAFHANGGTGTMSAQSFTYDEEKPLSACGFSRAGKLFAGWAVSADGDVLYPDGQSVKNLAAMGSVTLYAKWVDESWTVSGEVKEGEDEESGTPAQGISVSLNRGDVIFGSAQSTGLDGRYSFSGVPAGLYNLVATRTLNGKPQTVTALVEVSGGNVDVSAIVMPDANISSKIDVQDDTPAVMVGGLDAVALENAEEGSEVTVTMTVETKSEKQAEGASELRRLAEEGLADGETVGIDFLDISIGKTIGEGTDVEAVTETAALVELVIPFTFAGRKNFRMMRFHDDEAQEFRRLSSGQAQLADGTYLEDPENNRIFVYSSRFSTFAISYESISKYVITFHANDGTEAKRTQEVAADAAMPVSLDANRFSREGHNFAGWNTLANGNGTSYRDGARVTIDSDLTLYAQWTEIPPEPVIHTVRFNMCGHGTAIDPQQIPDGGRVTRPAPDPTAVGFTFGGWYTEVECRTAYDFTQTVSSDFYLYAKWVESEEQFTVSFNMMSHGEEIPAQTVSAGQLLERPDDPVDEVYDFIGWYTEEELENEYDFETPVTADFWLYAKWTIKQHSVSFNMAGKTVENAPETQNVEHGSAAARPAEDPEAEGFIFTDWYTEAACENVYDFATPVTEDIELFAGWREAQKFSVSFNMCGKDATDVPETQEVWEGRFAAEPATEPKAEGFKFAGWYREAECENHFNFSEPILADTVVYAKWIDAEAERFTVSFNLCGKPGTAPSSQLVEKGATATEPAVPEAKGFIFTGWYTEPECVNLYDFGTPVTADLMLYAGWREGSAVVIGGAAWNLYEDASVHEFKVSGINVSGTVANSNAKSKAYFDARISGSTITVSVSGDRKKAASNAILEFDLGKDGVIEYELPVSYVKPVFKLSSTTATIKNGTETVLKTTLLVKNEEGSFEPYDMTDVSVSGNGLGTVTKAADGSIEIRTSAAGKRKITVTKESWDGRETVSLAYNVKGSKKDVLAVDLQGLKTVVVNSNAEWQTFTFDVTLNGAAVSGTGAQAVSIIDKKQTGLATISTGGKLVIAYKSGVKKGNYTITLQAGEAKTNVKIKVSDKPLDKAVSLKLKTKYDVVTRQGMVVVPKLTDVGGSIKAVSVAESGFLAKLNAAGNIVIDYSGNAYDAKNLKIGTLTLTLTISGVEKPVTIELKNVKAKKTMPKTKAVSVMIPADASEAAGKVIGTANIVSSYKDSAGMIRTIKPVEVSIVGTPKGVEAKVNESDFGEIDIYSLNKKNASFKVKLTYAGGVTKTVTVKVKKK